jgi:alpha-tubulin suppressor-like RCC1 family protein
MLRNSIQGKLLLKSIYPLVASLFMTFFAFGQSETNNPITYDTTITEHAGGPSYTWYVRITRQANDRTPRPAIFSMQGTGEVGSNPATLLTYGPHWWLANGWDGSVKLGNGTHYPVLVTIMEPAQNMRPWDLKVVFEALLGALPINRNAVHVAGLSQGNFEWGELLSYSAYAGDHTTMGEIKSMVDLEGVGPGVNYSGYNLSYPGVFGYWARHYNGKFFGLEGSTDDQFVYPISENMNDSVPGSAFFAFENLGGGGHCCWNSMYDPSATNWTNSSPNVVSGNTQHPNTPGDYKAGSNIFQWELRQGDTTLVGSSATAVTPPTVSAGSDPTITLPTNSATLTGSATATSGTTISSEAWTQTSGPSTATISKPTGSVTTTVSNLVAGTYVFTFTATNNSGQKASATVDVVVNPLTASSVTAPVVSAGSAQTVTGSSATLTGTSTAATGTTLSTETWKETSGPGTATISKSSGSLSTAVSGLVAGTYVFTLTTTNNLGQAVSSTVTVVVKAAAATSTVPTVSAGSAQSLSGSSSFLQGTATAASGTTLSTETWKETSGPNTATINKPSGSLSTAIAGLEAGTYVFTFTATNNLGQSASSTVNVVVKGAASTTSTTGTTSTVPTVSAGSAQSLSGSSSYLQGTAKAASGTTLSSESWKETSGPNSATINQPTGSLSTAIAGLEAGTYVFTFTATNNLGQSASSTISVVVKGAASSSSTTSTTSKVPVVSAGSAQSLSGSSSFLQGTATAASGTTLSSESWKETSGPNTATINKPTGSLSTAIAGLEAGTYVFTLTATNNLGQSASSTVSVTVKGTTGGSATEVKTSSPDAVGSTTSTTSTLPVVSAGSAQTVGGGNSSFLEGTAKAASGTTLSSESWKQSSGPNTATINKPTGSLSTAISGLEAGTYVFTLYATNNLGQTANASVTVTVKGGSTAANTTPTVSVGAAQTITLPTSSAKLTSTATAVTGTTLTAGLWKQTSGPSTATLATASSASTSVTGLSSAGTYVFSYTATNNKNQTATGSTTVTVDAATTATAPKLTVEGDPTITLPTSSVTLTSTATAATGTTLVSGLWKEASGPVTATIASPSSSNTAITGLTTAGTYIFSYTIKNNLGQTATGNTTVIVNPAATTTSSSSNIPVIVSTGEYQTLFIDQSKHLWSIGGNLNTLGSNNVGIEGAICRVLTSPTDLQFSAIASGLHGGAAVDVNGYVWGWGQDESGELGNGTISNDMFIVPVKILTDVTGAPFNNVSQIYCYYANSENRGGYAIKNDGTLWIWGDAEGGMLGNGTAGSFITRPTQIVLPGGRKAKQLAAGNTLVLLCTDGTVWTCGGAQAGENPNLGYESTGNDYLTLHQISLPTNIVQVAGATNEFSYALTSTGTLYGWGRYGSYMGGTGGYAANTYLNTPTDLTSRLNLPHPVRSITANMVCSHAILTDGTLWGWGDNSQGSVGNGHELNFAKTTVPYTWDFGPAELLQQAPVQITTRNDFVAVWGAGPFVLFDFAETSSGQLYSWGRNKGAVLGNGIIGCTPPIQASYPNSWDVTTATAVNPLAQTTVKYVASPYCTANPLVGQCPSCLLAVALQNPTAVASVSVTNATNAVLTATSTTTSTPTTTATTGTTGTILESSSPAEAAGTAALSTNTTAAATTDTTATDATAAAATTPVGTVSTTTGTLRVQATGSFSVATLDGSQSRSIDSTGTIVGYHWSQAAGPQTIIRDTTAATTDVIGLAPGTYAFRLTVTDNEGRSSSAIDSLIIGNASPAGLPGADASNTAGLMAYPTVAHSNVSLVLNGDLTGTVRLNVYNSTGSLVQAQELSKAQGEMVTNLDISSLSAGVYIVQALVGGQTSFTTKFIKQ